MIGYDARPNEHAYRGSKTDDSRINGYSCHPAAIVRFIPHT